MKIVKKGIAGTLESSDVLISVSPPNGTSGITIDLDSVVKKQFGSQIISVVHEMIEKHGVADAVIELNDKGALDCTIRARLEAALYQAAGVTTYKWGTKE